jgi:hypothetical protein
VAQRGVQQVGRAVVGADARRRSSSTFWWSVSPTFSSPLRNPGASRWSLPSGFDVSSTSPSKPLSAAELSGVADLAAAFGVEGRLVEQQLHLVALAAWSTRCRP